MRRTPASPRLLAATAGAGILGYALCPPSWTGRTLAGQLIAEPGVVTALVDAALWMTVVVLVARATEPAPPRTERLPYA